MSGYYNRKTNTDETKKIDIRKLQRNQHLSSGYIGRLSWQNVQTKESMGSINFEVMPDCVIFMYRVKHNEHWHNYETIAPLTYTPCNYGNSRVWFECPQCRKRVAILYVQTNIACRTCQHLNYASQQQTKGVFEDRDRMNKIRAKLNWSIFQDVYPSQRIKPKGMHYKTFYRLVIEHDYYELSYLSSFGASLNKLERMIGRF